MFGPNPRTDFGSSLTEHHRSEWFHSLLIDLEEEFVEKFGLQEYDILFLTGNGTLANEAVIYSLWSMPIFLGLEHEFGLRLGRTGFSHMREIDARACGRLDVAAYVLYETSISRRNDPPNQRYIFADMVSAFPYYLPPKQADIFTTVSSKQLGALPVLGIVGIRKGLDVWGPETWSVLSIPAHLRFRAKHETMTTPAIPLYCDLLRAIQAFDRPSLIEKIDRRRRQVVKAMGAENVIGEGPVVTLKPGGRVNQLAQDWNFYHSPAGPQVFLWSGTDEQYKEVFGV